ncbi:hypothetical protein BSKO_05988 [Bryopsis sp. KO-2023]|nr:hypothetical protein BSKO_05988 [Bryopsis sp. KO-2023]
MFWRVGAFAQASTMEAILDKEEFTLEDLLEEEDLIQECKSLNGRLINFLGQKENVEKMVGFLVDAPEVDADEKRKTKYPFSSCEVFCCEVDAIFTTLLETEELMNKFFSVLEGDGPVDCTAAGYFGRVMSHLLLRKPAPTLQHLQNHPEIIPRLVNHIYDTSISEVILRLVCADEQSNTALAGGHLTWLCETPLLDCLLERLSGGGTVDSQINSAQVLVALIRTQPSPLAIRLSQSDYLDLLVSHVKKCESGEVSIPVLNVCIAAMDPRRRIADGFGMLVGPICIHGEEHSGNVFMPLIGKLSDAVPSLVKYLERDEGSSPQLTPYGLLDPPAGVGRLKITELFSVLMCSGWEEAQQALLESGALPKCMQLFLKYPFNNLLHRNVAVLMAAAVDSGSEKVLEHLFNQDGFLDWLVSVPEEVLLPRPPKEGESDQKKQQGALAPIGNPSSCLPSPFDQVESGSGPNSIEGKEGEAPSGLASAEPPTNHAGGSKKIETDGENSAQGGQATPGVAESETNAAKVVENGPIFKDVEPVREHVLRAGYIGHVTQMANHVVMVSERDEWVRCALQEHSGWDVYVTKVLAARNTLEDVSHWECGRPSPGIVRPESPEAQSNQRPENIIGNGENYRYPLDEEDDDVNGAYGAMEGLTVTGAESATAMFAQLNLQENVQSWEDLTSSSSSSSSSSESSGSSVSGGGSDSDEGSPKQRDLKGVGGGSRGECSPPLTNFEDQIKFDSSDEEDDEDEYGDLVNGVGSISSGGMESITLTLNKQNFFATGGGSQGGEGWVAFGDDEGDSKISKTDVRLREGFAGKKEDLSGDGEGGGNSREEGESMVSGDYSAFNYWRTDVGAFEVPESL